MSDRPPRDGASYEALAQLPPNVIGELVDGELHVSPRPALRHCLAASVLASELIGPFGRGKGGPGGWVILAEPELHLRQTWLPWWCVPSLSTHWTWNWEPSGHADAWFGLLGHGLSFPQKPPKIGSHLLFRHSNPAMHDNHGSLEEGQGSPKRPRRSHIIVSSLQIAPGPHGTVAHGSPG
ncbi:hypothetical protein [Hyalangium minutum]|uniref:hypothetical protein n=1 Tax=Hyalangium minutum TaxID=394096 RepID=UPI0004E7A032|nr:hypothetical protein [Hyalangium minutum]